jgi:hypothetical protein
LFDIKYQTNEKFYQIKIETWITVLNKLSLAKKMMKAAKYTKWKVVRDNFTILIYDITYFFLTKRDKVEK